MISAALKDSFFALTCGRIVRVSQMKTAGANEIIIKARAVTNPQANRQAAKVNQILTKVKRAPVAVPQLEDGYDDICKYVRFRGAVISRDLKDSTFKLLSGEIIKVLRVKLTPEKETIIEARVISDLRVLFTSTLDSRELGIFSSSLEVERRKVTIRPADIEHKFFVMPIRDGDYGLLPMSRIGGDNFDSM